MTKENAASMGDGQLLLGAVAIIAFTERGCALARRIAEGLSRGPHAPTCTVSGPERYSASAGVEPYASLASWTAGSFARADALVFVGATGIAVRAIAPHVRDKFSDPAVVSVDEAGRFAVPLLSGHVGGANELARTIADLAGGQAVVSTATDVNGLFAVDEWAARRGLRIIEREIAKDIAARLLAGGVVGFASDFDVEWDVPADAIAPADELPDLGFAACLDDTCRPFERTLHLVPPVVTVGVGCRKGLDPAVLERSVDAVLDEAGVSRHAVCTLASIDVKKDEAAIAQLAGKRGWRLRFYTAEELKAVPGSFDSSEFVERTVGVGNVCERAAVAAGGTLLAGKHAGDGATVALAIDDNWPLRKDVSR